MNKSKIILGIETSCDETSAAVLKRGSEGRVQILSNIIASSASLQSKYGGIIPEQAAREQLKSIIPVIKEALSQSKISFERIDAIACTQGPGLIGSLLVGVETAKVLSIIYNKPLIPVNHLIGHFYANWISADWGGGKRGAPLSPRNEVRRSNGAARRQDPSQQNPIFPCIGLLVSGGHSDLVLFKDHNDFEYLGGTRDDAAGECFDKCARLLNLPYPGGPQISKHAAGGNPKAFNLPRPMAGSGNFDFSFSGLKTSVANLLRGPVGLYPHSMSSLDAAGTQWGSPSPATPDFPLTISDICASIEQAIIDSLIGKTIVAVQEYNAEQLIVAGGVAANSKLRTELEKALSGRARAVRLSIPEPILCTDNAAMIAAAAFFTPEEDLDPLNIQANPNLSLAY